MRVRADEHVSPEIVATVCRVCLSPDWALDHVYEVGDEGAQDQHWITRFAEAGGSAILTADRDFCSKAPQVVAVFNTGMKVIHLPPKWGTAKCHMQAAHILLWWPRIEGQIQSMRKRECYRPPWNLNSQSGEFKKVEIDFAKAHKKLRKAKRRSA